MSGHNVRASLAREMSFHVDAIRSPLHVVCARAGAQCQPLSSHKVRQAKSRRNRQQTSAHGVKQAATKADVLKHLVASYKHCVRGQHACTRCMRYKKNRNNFRNTNIAESRSEKHAVPACMREHCCVAKRARRQRPCLRRLNGLGHRRIVGRNTKVELGADLCRRREQLWLAHTRKSCRTTTRPACSLTHRHRNGLGQPFQQHQRQQEHFATRSTNASATVNTYTIAARHCTAWCERRAAGQTCAR